jgi:hypothetical protein
MAKAHRPNPGGRRPGAGRPRGRPNHVARDIAVLARQYSGEALAIIVAIMTDRKAPHSVRLAAALAVLDRGHGRPTQHMLVDLEVDPNELSDAQLAAIPSRRARTTCTSSSAANSSTGPR